MGMPMELNTMIVTKGREEREEENIFRLKKEGYRLYPIDIPLDIRKTIESESSGTAVIQKVEWQNEATTITYKLKTGCREIDSLFLILNIRKG